MIRSQSRNDEGNWVAASVAAVVVMVMMMLS